MFLAPLLTVWKWVKSGDNPAHFPYNGTVKNYQKRDKLSTKHAIPFKIRQWAWHRLLLGENPYLGICLTDFNQIRYITFFSYFYVRKSAKSDYNRAYFPYKTILNTIWFFHFQLCKSSNNDCIGVKLCVNNAIKMCHLVTKNCLNQTKTVQAPRYWICGPQLTF